MPRTYNPIYTMDELAHELHVSPRRIRSWVEKGLLPKAEKSTVFPRGGYTDLHLRIGRTIIDSYDNNVTYHDLRDRIQYIYFEDGEDE